MLNFIPASDLCPADTAISGADMAEITAAARESFPRGVPFVAEALLPESSEVRAALARACGTFGGLMADGVRVGYVRREDTNGSVWWFRFAV